MFIGLISVQSLRMKKTHTFLAILALRIALALLSSVSVYNADETWQSTEIAHYLVFGLGHRTWEWVTDPPIRSYLHPIVFAPAFYLLKITRLDDHWAITIAPRLTQAVISSISDYCFLQFFKDNFSRTTFNFAMLYFGNGFLNCLSSRTLINTMEMSLTNIALYFYSRSLSGRSNVHHLVYVALISLSFTMRATTVLFWFPLVLNHFLILYRHKLVQSVFLGQMVPTACLVLLSVVAIDSYLYGKLVVATWNFFQGLSTCNSNHIALTFQLPCSYFFKIEKAFSSPNNR